MRCARCDRIAVPQILGRAEDGRLVFGWCLLCLHDEGCEPIDPAPLPLRTARDRSIRRSWRRLRRRLRSGRPLRPQLARRLTYLGLTALLLIWAVVLSVAGGVGLPARTRHGLPNGSGLVLLAGGGITALIGLSVLMALAEPRRRARIALRVVQVAASVVAFGSLIWGVIDHQPARDPVVLAITVLALGVAWGATRFAPVPQELERCPQPML